MNCCVAESASVGLVGVTLMLVSVWFTVTETLDVTDSPPASLIVTRNVYAPNWPNVAVLFFAALVPLALKVGLGAPPGLAVVDHVYVKPLSPASSDPRAARAVLVPVTGDGDALAAAARVGAVLATVMVAESLMLPLLALTVYVPPVAGAV